MDKITAFYNKCKITVDDFNRVGNDYECHCYTDGVPDEVEPEMLIKKVTHTEIEWLTAGLNGMVTVTNPNDTQETEDMPFWRWLASIDHHTLTNTLQHIINTREGRDKTWNVQADAMYLTIKKAA